jgi:capsular exopolysaccharide synthesis family protein
MSVELADYLKLLRRRWWLIAVSVVLATAGAGAATAMQAPRYTTSTRLLVAGSHAGATPEEGVARTLANQRAAAYAQLIPTGPAMELAAKAGNATGAAPSVTAFADGNSPFILISVEAGSAQAAQNVAVAYPRVLPKIIGTLEQVSPESIPLFTVLEPAPLPSSPTSPQPLRNLLVGVVVGMIMGFAGAVLRETLDARVRDSAEIEKLAQVDLLGTVPRQHGGEALPARTKPRSGRAEAYRHIRANLEFSGPDGMPASIAITSPGPGEGKSSLAANLALVAAHAGRTVVIVDADLRKPTIAKYFGVPAAVGLSDVLAGRWLIQETLVPVAGERIWVVPSGPVPSFPSELVGSAAMADIIIQLEQHFDLVIIDTPPVLPVSDALHVAVNVGGVIVVARMAETRRLALKKAVDAITKVNARILGVVGNAAVKQEESGYGYGYGYGRKAGNDDSTPVAIQPALRRKDLRPSVTSRRGRRAQTAPPEAPHRQPEERFTAAPQTPAHPDFDWERTLLNAGPPRGARSRLGDQPEVADPRNRGVSPTRSPQADGVIDLGAGDQGHQAW